MTLSCSLDRRPEICAYLLRHLNRPKSRESLHASLCQEPVEVGIVDAKESLETLHGLVDNFLPFTIELVIIAVVASESPRLST